MLAQKNGVSRLNLGLFGHIVSHTDHERIIVAAWLAAAFLVITVIGVLFNAASFYTIARTALFMIHTLRSRIVGHLRSLSLRYHANQSIGDSIWRAINDARSIQEVMIYGVRTWAVVIFRVLIMVVFMLLLDPLLTLVALAVMPLLFYTIHRLTGRIQRTSQESREHMSRLTSLIEQTMGAIRAVQVFGREGMEQRRFDDTSLSFVRAQLSFAFPSSSSTSPPSRSPALAQRLSCSSPRSALCPATSPSARSGCSSRTCRASTR